MAIKLKKEEINLELELQEKLKELGLEVELPESDTEDEEDN